VRHPPIALVAVTATTALLAIIDARAQQPVFKGGVDLVNVTATVTDGNGRFISGLTKDNFVVYDEGKPQEIVTFSTERVPVSLGMLLDVSASMTEDRLATARAAINHFILNLLGKEDELFLLEFAGRGRMLQTWTQDRDTFSRALSGAKGGSGNFGTALFDAVATSLGIAADGAHQKKLVLILSDGKDTSSLRSVKEAQEAIRRSEVLVYALGVDGTDEDVDAFGGFDAGVDARSLRKLTDDTGGRTEVVKGFKNLNEATGRLADELNQQYSIGYAAPPSYDGRWHAIKVEVVKKRGAKVRSRSGYFAVPGEAGRVTAIP
jgi:Ca-activated chloride channel family protein